MGVLSSGYGRSQGFSFSSHVLFSRSKALFEVKENTRHRENAHINKYRQQPKPFSALDSPAEKEMLSCSVILTKAAQKSETFHGFYKIPNPSK